MAQICGSRNRTPGDYPSASSSREDYRGYQSLAHHVLLWLSLAGLALRRLAYITFRRRRISGTVTLACWAEARVTRYSTVLEETRHHILSSSNRPARTKLRAASIFVPTYRL